MATNTCMSVIQYKSEADWTKELFFTARDAFAREMCEQGKSESFPNQGSQLNSLRTGIRHWINHAAAQEFIDWIVANAPAYDVTIVSSSIEDLP